MRSLSARSERAVAFCLIFGSLITVHPASLHAAPIDTPETRLAAAKALLNAADEKEILATRIDLIVNEEADAYRRATPQASDEAIHKYAAILRQELARNSDAFLAARAKYYADRFSTPELQEWASNLQTPLGRKMVKIAPGIMRDLYGADMVWVKEAMERTQARLQAAKAQESNP